MKELSVDLDLVRKYDVPGPRYTSYPPATRFSEEYDVNRLSELIQAVAERPFALLPHSLL